MCLQPGAGGSREMRAAKSRGEAAAAPCRGFRDAALTSGRRHSPGAEERDEPGHGEPLHAAPGLCGDLGDLRGDKPDCAGVSVWVVWLRIEGFRIFCTQGYKPLTTPSQLLEGDVSLCSSIPPPAVITT